MDSDLKDPQLMWQTYDDLKSNPMITESLSDILRIKHVPQGITQAVEIMISWSLKGLRVLLFVLN